MVGQTYRLTSDQGMAVPRSWRSLALLFRRIIPALYIPYTKDSSSRRRHLGLYIPQITHVLQPYTTHLYYTGVPHRRKYTAFRILHTCSIMDITKSAHSFHQGGFFLH